MAQDPLTAKLGKARDSVARLCEFFAARRGMTIADGAAVAAGELVDAARATDDRLRSLVLRAGAVPLPPAAVAAGVRPVGALEAAKIERFAAYLRELEAWFAAQPGPPSTPAGVIEVQRTQALIARIVELVDELTLGSIAPADPPEPVDRAGRAPASPAPAATAAREPAAGSVADAPKMVVLDDTDSRPMVQEFRGIKELTPDCKQLVGEFLAAWGIKHSPVQRKKLLDRLLRWITSAPEGQVLVLKMKTVTEPMEPYPAYVSRNLLAGAEQAGEP